MQQRCCGCPACAAVLSVAAKAKINVAANVVMIMVDIGSFFMVEFFLSCRY